MNERLQELYLVASEKFKIVQDQGLPAPYQARAFAEKFALLIVRECIEVVEDSQGYNQYFPHVAENIKQHFGVE